MERFEYTYEQSIGWHIKSVSDVAHQLDAIFKSTLSLASISEDIPFVGHVQSSRSWCVFAKQPYVMEYKGLVLSSKKYSEFSYNPYTLLLRHFDFPFLDTIEELSTGKRATKPLSNLVRVEPGSAYLKYAYIDFIHTPIEQRKRSYWSIIPIGAPSKDSPLSRFAIEADIVLSVKEVEERMFYANNDGLSQFEIIQRSEKSAEFVRKAIIQKLSQLETKYDRQVEKIDEVVSSQRKHVNRIEQGIEKSQESQKKVVRQYTTLADKVSALSTKITSLRRLQYLLVLPLTLLVLSAVMFAIAFFQPAAVLYPNARIFIDSTDIDTIYDGESLLYEDSTVRSGLKDLDIQRMGVDEDGLKVIQFGDDLYAIGLKAKFSNSEQESDSTSILSDTLKQEN